MKKLFFTLCFLCHAVSGVKHSLKFFLTRSSGMTTFPEFVSFSMVDEVVIGYCDSMKREVELKQEWTKKVSKERPFLLQWSSRRCLLNDLFLKANMEVLKQHLNQTEGSHVLQRMGGCEWDEESGEIKGFNQYGYDGEDFISLDMQTMTWITPKANVVMIKHLWDADNTRLDTNKNLYMLECPKLLQDYIRHGRSFLQRTKRPSVFLLQRTPSSPVSCHATGFYPDRADLFWRKDGEEIHEGVEKGEILPNNDGTFQINSKMNVSLVNHKGWRKYDCVFQLYGVKEEIIIALDKTEIQTNWVSPSEFLVPLAVGGVASMVLFLVFSGFLYCWGKKNGFKTLPDDQRKEEEFTNE